MTGVTLRGPGGELNPLLFSAMLSAGLGTLCTCIVFSFVLQQMAQSYATLGMQLPLATMLLLRAGALPWPGLGVLLLCGLANFGLAWLAVATRRNWLALLPLLLSLLGAIGTVLLLQLPMNALLQQIQRLD